MEKSRNFALDLLRVFACYMVIQVHAGEFYYIGEGGSILNGEDASWANIYNSLFRTAVPLFVMLTGYFVLPVKLRLGEFLTKRFTRVLIPFVIWCIIYAFYAYFRGQTDLMEAFKNITHIPVNYGVEIGHLWYVYMLIGLYLFFPIISPWLNTASRNGLHFYIGLWAVTLTLPYIHEGIEHVWGECFWNPTPMLYYFSGLLGFAILGFYMKKFCQERSSWDSYIGFFLISVGYLFTILIFNGRLHDESIQWISDLELSWGYGTINVAMMTVGLFLLFKNIKNTKNKFITQLVGSISKMSYGIYLAHIIVLNFFHFLFDGMFDTAAIKIPLIAVCTFAVSYVIIKILSYIPKSKYLIG